MPSSSFHLRFNRDLEQILNRALQARINDLVQPLPVEEIFAAAGKLSFEEEGEIGRLASILEAKDDPKAASLLAGIEQGVMARDAYFSGRIPFLKRLRNLFFTAAPSVLLAGAVLSSGKGGGAALVGALLAGLSVVGGVSMQDELNSTPGAYGSYE